MNLHTFIGNCCGVNKFSTLPLTKDGFIREAKRLVRRQWGTGNMRGSHIICTTNNYQTNQASYLEELGFTKVSEEYNTNSRNRVTVWIMSRVMFNRKIRNVKLPGDTPNNIFSAVA